MAFARLTETYYRTEVLDVEKNGKRWELFIARGGYPDQVVERHYLRTIIRMSSADIQAWRQLEEERSSAERELDWGDNVFFLELGVAVLWVGAMVPGWGRGLISAGTSLVLLVVAMVAAFLFGRWKWHKPAPEVSPEQKEATAKKMLLARYGFEDLAPNLVTTERAFYQNVSHIILLEGKDPTQYDYWFLPTGS